MKGKRISRYWRNLILLFLVAALPAFLFVILSRSVALRQLYHKIYVTHLEILNAHSLQLDQLLENCFATARQGANNANLIHAVHTDLDALSTENRSLVNRTIDQSLSQLVENDRYLHSAYLRCNLNKLVFSSNSSIHNADSFFDSLWLQQYDYAHADVQLLEQTRTVLSPYGEQYRYLSMVSKLPYLSDNLKGELVLNFNADALYRFMFGAGKEASGIPCVYSKSGQLLLSPSTLSMPQSLNELEVVLNPNATNAGFIPVQLDSLNYHLVHTTNTTYGWQLVTFVPDAQITTQFNAVTHTHFYLFAAYLALMLVLCLLLAHLLQRPMQALLTRIHEALPGIYQSKAASADSYTVVGDAYLALTQQKHEITDMLHTFHEPIKESVFSQLLTSETIDDTLCVEISHMLETLHCSFAQNLFCVALIRVEAVTDLKRHLHRDAYCTLKEDLRAACAQICSADFQTVWFWLESNLLGGILNFSDGISPNMLTMSLSALGIQLQDTGIKMSEGASVVAFGNSVEELFALNRSYAQAQELLQYKVYHHKDYPCCYNRFVTDSLALSYDKQKLVMNHIKLGHEREACEILENYYRVVHTSPYSELNAIQEMSKQIVQTLAEALAGVQTEPNDLLGDKQGMYEQIDACVTVHDIANGVLELVRRACRYTLESLNAKSENRMQSLLEWIEENYNTDISLGSIATQMNLSPTYASKLFKAHTGTDVVTYVNTIKLRHAQKLLRDTKMSVAEIGAYVGFNHAQSFIRSFKKHVGMTPTNYRTLDNGDLPDFIDPPVADEETDEDQ